MFILNDSNISENQFTDFLSLCFEISDEFSLTEVPYIDRQFKILDLYAELKDYCVKEIPTKNWYDLYTPEYTLTRYIYKTCDSTFQVLNKLFDNIFFISSDGETRSNLEDICFFKDKKIIVGTLSHGELCHVFNKNNKSLNKVLDFAQWEKHNYFENKNRDYTIFKNDYFIIDD